MDSDFEGLKATNHLSAQLEILSMSDCNTAAVALGEFTTMKRLVSSANKCMCAFMSAIMSFIYSRVSDCVPRLIGKKSLQNKRFKPI